MRKFENLEVYFERDFGNMYHVIMFLSVAEINPI